MDDLLRSSMEMTNDNMFRYMERVCCYSEYRQFMKDNDEVYFIPEKEQIKESFDLIKVSDWDAINTKIFSVFDISPTHLTPILPKVYFKCRFSGLTFFAAVYTDFEKNESELFLYLIHGGKWKWFGSAFLPYEEDMTFHKNEITEEDEEPSFNIGINTCFTSFYREWNQFRKYVKQNCNLMVNLEKTEEYISKLGEAGYYQMGEGIITNAVRRYFQLLEHIHTLLDERQLKQPSETDKPAVMSTKTDEGITKVCKSSGKPNVIDLGNVTITIPKGSATTRKAFYQRKCLSWTVRGHYRHYKNGKTVYIKPFQKGKNRNQSAEQTKIYKV